MFVRIVRFATFTYFLVPFFPEKCVDRFVNCLATVGNDIFKPIHLPNIPRNNFGNFQ